MKDFEEQPEGEIEQAVKDIETATLCLRTLSEYFGFEFDEEVLENEIACLAGYLSECRKSGRPTDIMSAIREYYYRDLRTKRPRTCMGRIFSAN